MPSWSKKVVAEYKNLFALNMNDTRNFAIYRSVDTMLTEREFQKRYRCRIHPHSRFRAFWDLFYCGFILINILYCCFSWAVSRKYSVLKSWTVHLHIFADMPVLLNILFNFTTGFYESNHEEALMTLSAIGKNYIRFLFWFDVFGLILGSPLSVHLFAVKLIRTNLTMHMIYFGIIFLGVCSRTVSPLYYWKNKVTKYFNLDNLISSAIEYFLFFPMAVAILAVLAYLIQDEFLGLSTGDTISDIAVSYFNVLLKVWTSSSYPSEYSNIYIAYTNLFFLLIPYIRYFLISTVLVLIFWSNKGASEKYNDINDNLKQYLQQVKISDRLKIRFLKYYEVAFDGKFYNENELMDNVSSELREDIASLKLAKMRDLSLLKAIPLKELIAIGRLLVYEVYFGNDVIAYRGSLHDRMYFIVRGSVALFTDSAHEISHMANGNHIMISGILPHFPPLTLNYVVCETAILYSLSRTDYASVADKCPVFAQLIDSSYNIFIEMAYYLIDKEEEVHQESLYKAKK